MNSPIYRGGLWQKSGEWSVDPVRLCDGLAALCRTARGANSRVDPDGRLRGNRGRSRSPHRERLDQDRKALLATSAFRVPVRQIRHRVIPVYDYVLVTEPPTRAQWVSARLAEPSGNVGLLEPVPLLPADRRRAGGRDRPGGRGRILWGGYDAIYNFGGKVETAAYQRDRSFAGLAQRFFTAFPQLEGVRFSHRWGGAIDTCSRFLPSTAPPMGGKVGWAVGHTGLGSEPAGSRPRSVST